MPDIDKKLFRNPAVYTSDRGLSNSDQKVPIEVTEVDSSWMKAAITENKRSGLIVDAANHQSFVPYQTQFETKQVNTWGFAKQSDKHTPWADYSVDQWSDTVNFPPDFRGIFDIKGWYDQKFETTKELAQWKTDIFRNQYGLYKDFGTPGSLPTLYSKLHSNGEFWVCNSTGYIAPAVEALSALYTNHLASDDTSVYNNLITNKIKDIDVFYDVLMVVTPTEVVLDKIFFDYNTGAISSSPEYSHTINLSSAQGGKFADVWFFEDTKKVNFCNVILDRDLGKPKSPEDFTFLYYRELTIDHTLIPSTQTDFPVLVNVTAGMLKSASSGGHVISPEGHDIGFYADIAGTTKLSWELASYDGTTGKVTAWVKIPTLSSATDTKIFMFYSDASITTDQSDSQEVWSNGYVSAWHLGDGTALNASDVLSKNDGTSVGSLPTTSNIAGAASFNGTDTSYISIPSTASQTLTSLTFGGWVKSTAPGSGYRGIFTKQYAYGLFALDNKLVIYDWGNGTPRPTGLSIDDGDWHYVVMSGVNNTTNGMNIYLDGTLVLNTTNVATNYTLPIAFGSGNASGQGLNGSVSEPRLSSVERSDDWITTEYNNQDSPTTFVDRGPEVIRTSGIPVPQLRELDLETDKFNLQFPLPTNDLTALTYLSAYEIMSIDYPIFTYNESTKTYAVAMNAITVDNETIILLMAMSNKEGIFDVEGVWSYLSGGMR